MGVLQALLPDAPTTTWALLLLHCYAGITLPNSCSAMNVDSLLQMLGAAVIARPPPQPISSP